MPGGNCPSPFIIADDIPAIFKPPVFTWHDYFENLAHEEFFCSDDALIFQHSQHDLTPVSMKHRMPEVGFGPRQCGTVWVVDGGK